MKMGTVRAHNKKTGAKRPSGFPSFVYRQDGHELSYEIFLIIRRENTLVKPWKLGYNIHYLQEKGGNGMKRILALLLVLGMLCTGCQVASTPETSAPAIVTTQPTTLPATAPTTEPTTVPTTEPTTVPTTEETVPEAVPVMAEADIHELSALYAFVYDLTNGQLLYTHGDQQAERTPASLTKLLTICTALEYLDPVTVITAGVETTWIDPLSSVANVKTGNQLTVEQLVQGMMMQSGNDAAFALAVAAGKSLAGAEELTEEEYLQVFMDYMNRRAWEQGMKNTFFVTPDGTTAPNHHTTPEDLLIIAKLALDNPLIRQYAACQQAQVTFISGEEQLWTNTNWLMNPESMYYTPEAIGLKTGSTNAAGNCFLGLFDHEGREILICVLGCPTIGSRFRDSLTLYEIYKDR